MLKNKSLFLLLFLCFFILTTCKKVGKEMMVSTGEISNILVNSADVGGLVIDIGTGAIQHGHCYSTAPNVTVSGTKTQLGIPSGKGGFSSQLTDLAAGTKYYVKAFISSGTETVYGKEKSFFTLSISQPVLTTTAVSNVTATTATSGGDISDDGGSLIISRGVCWNTAVNPTIENNITSDLTGTGSFTSSLTGLSAGTTYYVRAYAVNSTGTSYGLEVNFTTLSILNAPSVTTTTISSITQTTASGGGNVTSDGGSTITERGICYGLSPTPTTSNSKIVASGTTGAFTSSLTGLSANTTYYLRAYAINSSGTSYGSQVNFTTLAIVNAPVVTTTIISSIAQTTASGGGNVTSDGGSAITERGICYSISQTPTTSGSKIIASGTTGAFTSSLTGLSAGTTYYVRSYATNSSGTSYGSQVNFTTLALVNAPVVTTTIISSIAQTTASGGGNVTSDGGSTITERGICYSISQTPTTSSSKIVASGTTGAFTSSLTGLSANTTYYVRAYAINSSGTSYGSQVNFTTLAIVNAPVVTTTTISSIAQTTASGGGNVTSDGGSTITERGICYSISQTPTTSGSKIIASGTTGAFTSSLTGLSANTTYYVRAYAINSSGTSYGSQVNFTTLAIVNAPVVTTTIISSIAQTTASGGGNVTSDGGSAITERGICYSISQTPTTSGSKIIASGTTGAFTSNLTGLSAGTTYYVRAYATNSVGTEYGMEVSFTTNLLAIPTLTTSAASTITLTTAVLGGIIISEGSGSTILKGVCWGTASNPTISGTKSSIYGTGTGSFSSTISGLTENTIYYFRAYATNSGGTAYGNELSFSTTSEGPSITDIEGNTYKTINIGTQLWMKENLKATEYNDGTPIPLVIEDLYWAGLQTPSYSWYNQEEATYKETYGALYNWYVINPASNGGKSICPVDWHVPTDAEWHTMILFMDAGAVLANGESLIAGGKFRESGTVHWQSPNTGATNETGFTGLPGGERSYSGSFNYFGSEGYWWSVSESDISSAFCRYLLFGQNYVMRLARPKQYGFSVRCIKD